MDGIPIVVEKQTASVFLTGSKIPSEVVALSDRKVDQKFHWYKNFVSLAYLFFF